MKRVTDRDEQWLAEHGLTWQPLPPNIIPPAEPRPVRWTDRGERLLLLVRTVGEYATMLLLFCAAYALWLFCFWIAIWHRDLVPWVAIALFAVPAAAYQLTKRWRR
ncbi:hypothetical protein ACSMXN_09390 [Jatrophihabitans sp. DSM 45814]